MAGEPGQYILAIDPGRDKLGLAVLNSDGEVLSMETVIRSRFSERIGFLLNEYKPEHVVLGSGTGSDWVNDVMSSLDVAEVAKLDEAGSTLEARELAWKENPPRGIWKIVPRLFWPIPPDVDGWAAVVIGRRWLRDREH